MPFNFVYQICPFKSKKIKINNKGLMRNKKTFICISINVDISFTKKKYAPRTIMRFIFDINIQGILC